MRPRLILAAAVFATMAWTCVIPAQLSAAPNSALEAFPAHGHVGDTVFVSGTGFPPLARIQTITMACPNILTLNGNIQTVAGPLTDSSGNFSGFTMKALRLNKVDSSGCTIYATLGTNPFGPNIPAQYTILAPDAALDKCDRTMCVKVVARPESQRAGLKEFIHVEGWAGATGTATISYQHMSTQTFKVGLDWRGYEDFHVPIQVAVTKPVAATVRVKVRLHRFSGQGKRNFTVTH